MQSFHSRQNHNYAAVLPLSGIKSTTLSFSFKDFMPFREIYMAAFKNDIEYSQLVLHTAAVLQSNKFVQVILQNKSCISELGLVGVV